MLSHTVLAMIGPVEVKNSGSGLSVVAQVNREHFCAPAFPPHP
jgi:hypothetical protein